MRQPKATPDNHVSIQHIIPSLHSIAHTPDLVLTLQGVPATCKEFAVFVLRNPDVVLRELSSTRLNGVRLRKEDLTWDRGEFVAYSMTRDGVYLAWVYHLDDSVMLRCSIEPL